MTHRHHNPRAVIAAVVCHTGVCHEDLFGYYRTEPEVKARELCVILLRTYTSLSYPEITVAMGRKKSAHSTSETRFARGMRRASEDHEFSETLAALAAEFDPDLAASRERFEFETTPAW